MIRALVLVVAVLALSSSACSARVAGVKDVELTYESDDEPAPSGYGEDLRALVLRRFMAAGPIGADVTQQGRTLRIVVDEGLAAVVDELVTWSGTLLLLVPDPTSPGSPRDDDGLVARTEVLPDGSTAHYWEGSRASVTRAIERWNTDPDHRAVAEAVSPSRGGASEPPYRTRVVWNRPRGELGAGILVGWGRKGTLRLRAASGTPAERALAEARSRAQTSSPGEILVRGHTSLGFPTFDGDAAYVSFGDGIEAYARAQEEKARLTSPLLPPLRRVSAVGLPPDSALATACYLVPILLSIAWLGFVRRFDRAHPEPLWLVATTFVLGALATIPAGLAETALANLTPWLDPRVVTFGGRPFALPLAFVVFTAVVGVSEEGAKMLGTTFAVRRREFDEPIDGIVYGVVASLGFAAAENVHYFAMSRLAVPIVVARSFMSVPAHMFFGAIWGYARGARLVEARSRVLLFLLVAAAAHGLFDALLSTDGAGGFAVLLNVGLASVFVVLVRRALRHGVVDDATRAVDPERRDLFRVGRPKLFLLSSAALHVMAFGIVALGSWYQFERHRPTAVFVTSSSVMLALLALAAYGVSAWMPLDVVVDDYGVTFAGAARAWSRVRGFDVKPRHIAIECEDGPVLLGPASKDVLVGLAASLRAHIASSPIVRHGD